LRFSERNGDSRRERILVPEESLCAGHRDPAQEHVAVHWLDSPRTMRNRARCVDHGEIDACMSSDPVE